jgi:hypothetical protein
MIEPEGQQQLASTIREHMALDRALLDQLRAEIRPLRGQVRRIQPRSATAVSLVGTDGGNNRLQFDPFLVQLVRVVDASNNEYCLEAITPTTSVAALGAQQFDPAGRPRTPLGELLAYLGVRELPQLTHMIRGNDGDRPTSPSWVQVYRELVEWAILFALVRTKDFAKDLFARFRQGLEEGIERQLRRNRRRIYLAGVAKHSKVLDRYRLAMALERVVAPDFPACLEIPRDIEEKAYVWAEFARCDAHLYRRVVAGRFGYMMIGAAPVSRYRRAAIRGAGRPSRPAPFTGLNRGAPPRCALVPGPAPRAPRDDGGNLAALPTLAAHAP